MLSQPVEFARVIQLAESDKHGVENPGAHATPIAQSYRENEPYFQAIFDHAPVGIFVEGNQDNIIRVNKAAENMLGYTAEEIRGKSGVDFTHPDDIAISEHLYRQLLEGKRASYQLEKRYIKKDGEVVWARITVSLVKDTQGRQDVTIVLLEDITKRKLAERESLWTKFALEKTSDGACWIGPTGQIEYANPAACEMWGYSHEELLTKNVVDIDPNINPENWQATLELINERQSATFETIHRRKDGTLFPVEVLVNQLSLDGQSYHCSYVRDITQRKEAEEELREYTRSLERLNKSLEKANQAAQAATLSKNEFLANVSHEIRTPLTAIMGYVEELVEDGKPEWKTQQHVGAVDIIKRNCKYLLEIINDILDLSKIEADRLNIDTKEASPIQATEDIVRLMQLRAYEKGLYLNCEYTGLIPEKIQTDFIRLRQVLINLIGNAIKFTNTGGITLVVSFIPREGQTSPLMRFEVKDTGIGIAEENLKKLFVPFSQVDGSPTRRFGGAGLGLTISRRLAKMLGGDIDVKSTPDKGSTFTVQILTGPCDKVRLLSPSDISLIRSKFPIDCTKNTRPTHQFSGRVLLAEDDTDSRILISRILMTAGAHVDCVDNGRSALNKILEARGKAEAYDLVILDIQMPILNGYEVTKELRTQGLETPILALTANAMAGEREKCLGIGFDEYIRKPFDREQLLSLVAQYPTI